MEFFQVHFKKQLDKTNGKITHHQHIWLLP